MHCLRATRSFSFSSPFSHTFPSSKHSLNLLLRFPGPKPLNLITTMSSSSSAQTIEHIVLFKVKDNTEPTKVNAMVNNLNGLSSLDPVLHLSMGPLHRAKSSPFPFTHMLHSRYASKENLSAYSAHPSHVSVVRDSVLPICDDVMAVDWVAAEGDFNGPISFPPGAAIRVSFLKVKEGLGEEVKGEILGVIKGIEGKFDGIRQITCGENFSPARAKGYSIASLAVFEGLEGLEAVDLKEEVVNEQKAKVREYLDGVIVVDYVVPPAQSSASL